MNRRPFLLLIVATMVTELACNLPTGALPLALLQDGANAPQIALAMGGGMFAQLFGSVPVGALVDRFGRLLTIRVAVVLMALSNLGLAYLHGPIWGGAFVALRGFSMMAFVTGEFAYVTEIVPAQRSVSAVSTLGMLANLTFAFAPACAVYLWHIGIGREQFLYGAILTALGGAAMWLLPSRHDILTAHRSRTILMRSVWLPAMLFLIAAALQSGVNGSLAVLTFTHRGITNGALIFTSMAFFTFALRYPAGRFVDKYGPRLMALPVAVAQVAGCIVAARAYTPLTVLIAGALLGIAWSAVVPVGVGLFFEYSSRRTRGVAMGAYNLSFAIGTSSGAIMAALLVKFGSTYAIAIAACAIAPMLAVPWLFFHTHPSTKHVQTSATV
ncbi:MAG: MFS transporter [Candidatus Eremiobacteraeota bacterium]|nr:MFS transporter [Candidatus Eremiobacteraeota bacterium]